jgi:predicted kinase
METNPKKPGLVMFSGPPGVGKSSLSYRLARETGIAILTKDQIERTLITSQLASETGRLAYDLLIEIAEFNLQRGASLILDAVFGTNNLRDLFIRQAAANDATFYGIDCVCSDKALWQSRLATRPEMVPGWQPATWTESLRVQNYYEEWAYPHLTLDAVDSFENNYRKLLVYLGQ